MLNMLFGGLIVIVFFLCLFLAFNFGRRQQKKDKVKELTEQEKMDLEKQMKGMENILNYDYNVAIGKRVNK